MPAVAVAIAWLLLRPDVTLMLLLTGVLLVEGDSSGFLPSESSFYHTVFKGLTVSDLLTFGALAGMLVAAARRREAPAGVGPMAVALALLFVALISGAATAHYAGAKAQLIVENAVRLLHVIVLPFVVAELVRRRPALLRGLLVVVIPLVALKSLVGLYHAASGSTADVEGETLTYLQPTMNWVSIAFLLYAASAVFEKSRLSRWTLAAVPFVLADLVLSYRRSFWIAAVIGLAIVLVLGSRRGRLFMLLGLAAVGMAIYVALSGAGGTTSSSSPIVRRAISLEPSHLSANAEDRYRLDERKNVLAEVRRHPITGLGIGVPWRARDPLPLEHESGRNYTHIVSLWYWLNLGLLGVLAYVSLCLTTLYMAWKVWRAALDPLHRAVALALLGSLIGLIFAETTGSFTGVDARFSIVEPIALGILAAMWNGLPRPGRPASR